MVYTAFLDGLHESIHVTTIDLPVGFPNGPPNVVGDGFNDRISHPHF